MTYSQRDIILIPFPYSDLSGMKKRPALIVSTNIYNNRFSDLIVCVITSKNLSDDYSITLTDSDLESNKLPEQSVVKIHKLFTIDKNIVLKKFSSVKKEYFNLIIDKFISLIK